MCVRTVTGFVRKVSASAVAGKKNKTVLEWEAVMAKLDRSELLSSWPGGMLQGNVKGKQTWTTQTYMEGNNSVPALLCHSLFFGTRCEGRENMRRVEK